MTKYSPKNRQPLHPNFVLPLQFRIQINYMFIQFFICLQKLAVQVGLSRFLINKLIESFIVLHSDTQYKLRNLELKLV